MNTNRKKLKDGSDIAAIGYGGHARNLVSVLRHAKQVCDDPDLATRFDTAIVAIGEEILRKVERMYEPEKRDYKVECETIIRDAVFVTAADEEEAKDLADRKLGAYGDERRVVKVTAVEVKS